MRKRGCFASLLAFVLFSLSAITSHGDKVVLKNGRVIQCTVLSESETKVEIEVSGNRLSLPKANIETIEKLDPATKAITEGDVLLAGRKYDEAIAAYKRALATNPAEAQAKIEAAEKARENAEDKALAGMPPAAAEKHLRARLANRDLTADQASSTKAQLARVLMKRAELATLKRDYDQSRRYLEEARRYAPETPGLAVALVRVLQKQNENDPRIVQILRPHLEKNPDDVEAIEIYVNQIWKTDPWAALKVIYPDNKPHPKATRATKDLLPQILLACYNSEPYPKDAPLDRDTCRQHLMALRPDLFKAAAPVSEAPKATGPEGELMKVLLEVSQRDGRDNAMIHYVAASELMKPVFPGEIHTPTRSQTMLINQVLDRGWTGRAAGLLPLIQSLQPAFAEIRKGAALDYARNVGWENGPDIPVPKFLAAQVSAKLLCVEGRYFESQGRYGDALDNYLTALTMGRDHGAPDPLLIGGIILVAIEEMALEQINRLAIAGHLDRPTLDRALARLQAIERTQPSFVDMYRGEVLLSEYEIRLMREKPDEARKLFKISFEPPPDSVIDEAIKEVDRIQAEREQLWKHLIQFARTPYWERDLASHEARIKQMKTTFHPMSIRGTLNVHEADVRFFVLKAKLLGAQIATALAAYKLETGDYPQQLSELVPTYFKAVPTDPFSGQEFKYGPSPDGSRQMPYSVGPDMTDDRGAVRYDRTKGTTSWGDIFF